MTTKKQIASGIALLGDMDTYQEGYNLLKDLKAESIPALLKELDTPNQLIQGGLVEVIAGHGEAAVQPVVNALKSDSQIVQGNCINILTFIGEPSIDPLLDVIENSDSENSGIYMQAASRFGEHISGHLKKRLQGNKIENDSLFVLLIAADPTSIANYESKIIELLGSTDQTLVAVTTEALRHNGEDALPLLSNMIGEMNPYKQQNATNVFVALGAMAVDTLVEATGAISQLKQQNAVRALVEIGEPSIEAVSEALENGTSLQRQNAAIILKQLRTSKKKSSFFGRFSRK